MWTLLFALAARAEDVAAVLTVEGTVEVTRASGVVAAVPDLSLDRADVIKTGSDGAVILLLSNNRLVRVDEELSLPIANIVLLGSPASTVPIKVQLEELLYPGERASMRGVEDAERLAGFQSRISAATAVPAQSQAKASSGGGGAVEKESADAKPARTTRGNPPREAAAPAKPPPSPGGPPPAPTPPPPPPGASAPGYTREEVGGILADSDCLAIWRDQVALASGTSLVVHVRVEGGRITRLYSDGGLVPATCARDGLVGVDVSGGDGVFEVNVVLP